MKVVIFILLACLTISHCEDAMTKPTLDYKALYETAVERVKEANAVALQWKENAVKLEAKNQELATKVSDEKVKNDILRKQSIALGTASIPVKPTITKEGIPSDVSAKIESDVRARYPDSFTTQKYVIEGEKNSYLELNGKK